MPSFSAAERRALAAALAEEAAAEPSTGSEDGTRLEEPHGPEETAGAVEAAGIEKAAGAEEVHGAEEETDPDAMVLTCPACGGVVRRQTVLRPEGVAYVRRRLFLRCTGCGRSGAIDRPHG